MNSGESQAPGPDRPSEASMAEPFVSEAAKARVAEEYGYLPGPTQKLLGAWMTLLDDCDARWHRRWYPDPQTATATIMGQGIEYMRPEQQSAEHHQWRKEREAYLRQMMNLLANFQPPIIITNPAAGRPPPCPPATQSPTI